MRPDLRSVLRWKLGITLVFWALPCLLFPPAWFKLAGLTVATVETLVFCRLLGAAYLALCVGYAMCLMSPERHAGMRLVGIVSNGAASTVLWLLIVRGTIDALPALGEGYLIVSAVATAGLALALLVARAPGPKPPSGLSSALKKPDPAVRETGL